MALEFTNNMLRNNKHIVEKAVANNGEAIRFASDRLRNNKRIAVKAVRNSGKALRHVNHRLKGHGCYMGGFEVTNRPIVT